MTKNKESRALMEFMLTKLGGEDAVMMEFHSRRITEAAAEGLSLKELLAEADAGGWREWFDGMKLSQIAKIIDPPATASASPTSPRASTASKALAAQPGRRLSKVAKEALLEKVISFVAGHPWSRASEIAAAAEFDTRRLGPHLSSLRKAEKLQAVGERSGTRYALPGEKSKPA